MGDNALLGSRGQRSALCGPVHRDGATGGSAPRPAARGPIDSANAKPPAWDDPRLVSNKAVGILCASQRFKELMHDLEGLGVQIRPHETPLAQRTGGSYDFIANTVELPPGAFAVGPGPMDTGLLITVAHELKHAHQYRHLLKKSREARPAPASGPAAPDSPSAAEAARTRVLDAYMESLGKDKYLEASVEVERLAQKFGVAVALEALGPCNTRFNVYKEMFHADSESAYKDYEFSGWWNANENYYKEHAKIEWEDHEKRMRGEKKATP